MSAKHMHLTTEFIHVEYTSRRIFASLICMYISWDPLWSRIPCILLLKLLFKCVHLVSKCHFLRQL